MPAIRIGEFDTWQAGYGLAQVRAVLAGSDTNALIYTNEALTAVAENPQTLQKSTDDDGVSYGKFAVPLYTGQAYELVINNIDRTGVVRPSISDLDDEDASDATAIADGGTVPFAIEAHLARSIDVRDYGEWKAVGEAGASASTNNATLIAALGVAGAGTGGFVEVPSGTYQVTSYTIPVGTVIRGRGRVATTLLSMQAGNVVTIGGARAGFSRLTLDGSTLVAGSVGILAVNKDEIVLDDVEVKRFETGIYRKGGTRAAWRDVFISNCVTGYKAHGDVANALGAALRFNTWRGGKVELCTTAGIDLRYIDAPCEHNLFDSITFDTNTGTAVSAIGVRGHDLLNCRWTGNTNNLVVSDASPITTANTVRGLDLIGGEMSGGNVFLNDTLDLVAFRRVVLVGVAVTLTSPGNNVLIEDCRETSVSIVGDTTAWRRYRSQDRSASSLITTDGAFHKAWAITVEPGEHVYLEAKVIGRQKNGQNYYFAQYAVAARRPGSQLAYETQTGNFTFGNTLTGATSGATARIVADNDAGATGTLTLYDIVGSFVDGEIITDGATGSAVANGTLTHRRAQIITLATLGYDGQTVNFAVGEIITGVSSGAKAQIAIDVDGGAAGTLTLFDIEGDFLDNEAIVGSLGGVAVTNGALAATTSLIRDIEQNAAIYNSHFTANDTQIELRVSGFAGHTLDWIVEVDVTRS